MNNNNDNDILDIS